VFQGSLVVAIITIDGSEKPNRELGFELQSSHVIENRNNGVFPRPEVKRPTHQCIQKSTLALVTLQNTNEFSVLASEISLVTNHVAYQNY